MKSLRDYIAESENPVAGDTFAINIREECLIESHVLEVTEDTVVIAGDDRLFDLLEQYGYTTETIRRYGAVGSSPGMGYTLGEDELAEDEMEESALQAYLGKKKYGSEGMKALQQAGRDGASKEEMAKIRSRYDKMHEADIAEDELGRILKLAEVSPEDPAPVPPSQPNKDANRNDPLAAKAADDAAVGPMEEDGVDPVNAQGQDAEDLQGQATSSINTTVDEAEYQGRKVPLGKPMRGDTKKFKVYVKDPKTGNIKKVNFGHGGTSAKRAGQKTMSIKKSNPARRKSFRARHNCDNPGPRTKARYWSCRAW
jgi:hypothetical protein